MRKSLFKKDSVEELDISNDHQSEHGFSKLELSKIHQKRINGPNQPETGLENSLISYRQYSEADSTDFLSEFIKDSAMQDPVDQGKVLNEIMRIAREKGLKQSEIMKSNQIINILSQTKINCENVDHSQRYVGNKKGLKSSTS